jgi:hypothetical protein
MRTTITLEPDVLALVKKAMSERGRSFKEVVNETLRAGLGSARPGLTYHTPTFGMGFDPTVPWDKALQISAALEDEELIRRLAVRK